MADRRKGKKRKDEQEKKKPSKEEYAIAKHVRFNCPVKKSTLFGEKVDYFIASKAIDCLLDSKWAVNTKKAEAIFTTRESVVQYMASLMQYQCFFHRAEKLVKTVPLKKKKRKDEEEKTDDKQESEKGKVENDSAKGKQDEKAGKGSSDKGKDAEEQGTKKKKKVKLEPHDNQLFVDGNEVYVWIYDPVSPGKFLFGLLLVLGAVAISLFPLWPPEIRTGVYYLSLSGIGIIGSFLGLTFFRYILFAFCWCITAGKLHFWLFPNLDADVGFKESFIPTYGYEYNSSSKGEEDTSKKKNGDGSERRESSDSRESGEDRNNTQEAEAAAAAGNSDKDKEENVNAAENDDDFEVIQESDVVDQSTVDDDEDNESGDENQESEEQQQQKAE